MSSVLGLRGWWKSGNELVAFLAITQHLATHFSSQGTPHTVKYWSVQNKQKNSEKRLPTCSINYWGKPWQNCSDTVVTVVHPFIPFYHFGDVFLQLLPAFLQCSNLSGSAWSSWVSGICSWSALSFGIWCISSRSQNQQWNSGDSPKGVDNIYHTLVANRFVQPEGTPKIK